MVGFSLYSPLAVFPVWLFWVFGVFLPSNNCPHVGLNQRSSTGTATWQNLPPSSKFVSCRIFSLSFQLPQSLGRRQPNITFPHSANHHGDLGLVRRHSRVCIRQSLIKPQHKQSRRLLRGEPVSSLESWKVLPLTSMKPGFYPAVWLFKVFGSWSGSDTMDNWKKRMTEFER